MMTTEAYLESLGRHKGLLIKTTILGILLAVAAYFMLPKRFKVSTTIGLQTEYFQLPLVSGFLPETSDPSEMRAKREALIRTALNHQFLSQIADRYPIVKDMPDRAGQPQLEPLQKKFEIVPNGASSFSIAFSASDAHVAYQVVQDFLNRLQTNMIEERHTRLLNLHDAIREQLEALSIGRNGEGANEIYAQRPDLVQNRMETIRGEVEDLRKSYSDEHPRIVALQAELDRLSQWAKPFAETTIRAPATENFSASKVDPELRELFDDLLKKYRYLEVVIFLDQHNRDHYLTFLNEPFLPTAPISPKLPLLLFWGAAFGFILGAGITYLRSPKGVKIEEMEAGIRVTDIAEMSERSVVQ